MFRLSSVLASLALFITTTPALGQVVESTPNPARTDQSVTITFHADRGNEGLKDCNCDVYAHTGLITSESTSDSDWQYVMDEWPENRDTTKLEKVGDNTYELDIPDIRGYYSNNRTGAGEVPPKEQEEIRKMSFVFRNSDGTQEGKTAEGGDIFVEVNDVGESEPFVAANILAPNSNPPLYPFMTAKDTTVDVTITADTANIDSFTSLKLFVDGSEVASTGSDSLTYGLSMTQPNRFDIEAVAEAENDGSTLGDTLTTQLIRTPNVVEEARPSGVEDGINYRGDSKVILSIFAPDKNFAYAIGDFNDWEINDDYFLKRDGDHWWVEIDGLQSGTEYAFQYFVDGEHRIADPFAKKVLTPQDQFISDETYPNLKPYPDSKTENIVSVLETGQSDFDFSSFDPPPQDEMVVYELLLRDFVEDSDYQTLTDTLDYLDRLGVNAIELMPVAEFGGNNSWGYNPSFHFALDKSYGTPRQFKQFVEEAHSRGMAVILDVVYNHITGQSPLVQLYGATDSNPFLNVPASIPFSVFNQLDHSTDFVKNYLDRANEYWLEEYNVDGFRYDLAKGFQSNGVEERKRNLKRMADHIWDNVDSDAYVILELFGDPSEENELANYRFSETGGMMMWNNMNRPYNESSMGYITDSGFGSNIEPTYFEFSHVDKPNLIPYMESHDEQWLMRRNRQFGKETDNYSTRELKTALNRQKLVGAFFFTVPGPRMQFQFGELGYGYGENECLKPGDPGEDGECAPSDPGRTAPKPIRWDYRDPEQSPNRVRLYKTWQALLRLRNQNEVFSAPRSADDNAETLAMEAGEDDIVRWIKLEDAAMDAVIVGNFGVTPREADVTFTQTGTWYSFFEDETRQVDSATQTLRLLPGEFRIYTTEEQPAPPMGLVIGSPTQRNAASVSGDGRVDFGDTGVSIAFSGTSNSGEVTVEKFGEAPFQPSGIEESNVSQYRYLIESSGDLSFDDNTEVRFDVSTLAGVDDASNVQVYRRPTEGEGSFSSVSTSYDESNNELVATTGSFSEFVLASNSEPLPVELAGFGATLSDDQTVRLSWQTASETNNAGFAVQRRIAPSGASTAQATGPDWRKIGFVDGAGTTSEPQRYQFSDTNLNFAADSVQYRLKQIDADGSAHFSETVTVAPGPPDQLTLHAPFPNPARGQATIRYAVPSRQNVTLEVYDVLGRKVRTLTRGPQEGRQKRSFDASSLSSGMYILRLEAGSSVETTRLTVVK